MVCITNKILSLILFSAFNLPANDEKARANKYKPVFTIPAMYLDRESCR